MKLSMLAPAILLSSAIPFLSIAQSPEEDFARALQLEASGNPENAIDAYERISLKHHSSNLYANLGNLYFQKEDYGRAILYFRKALWLDPDDRELSDSLAEANLRSGAVENQSPRPNRFLSAHFQAHWLVATSLVFWFGILLGAYLIPQRLTPFSGTGYGLLWILSLGFLIWGFAQSQAAGKRLSREIVILSPKNDSERETIIGLRRFPGEGSSCNAQLKPGDSMLVVLDDSEKPRIHQSPEKTLWFLVQSHSGVERGWIKRDEFERVMSFVRLDQNDLEASKSN